MLNELLAVERGLAAAGISMVPRHSEIKDVRRMPTLLVRLADDGSVAGVRPVSAGVTLWTLRDGQKNSFPFVQLKAPLWTPAPDDPRRQAAANRKSEDRRAALLALATDAPWNADGLRRWPNAALLRRVQERRTTLTVLDETDAAAVPRAMERFVRACSSSQDDGPDRMLRQIAAALVEELEQVTDAEWLDVAAALLLGDDGALMFDADLQERPSSIASHVVSRVSAALQGPAALDEELGETCALTGSRTTLLDGNFPQPNLPWLGQTYLFARNRDTPAAGRYRRFAAASMPVGEQTVVRLSAALSALTDPDRRGRTWRDIPGEMPKQRDLLLAFVHANPDVPLANVLGDDGGGSPFQDDEEDEGGESAAGALSIARFEKRCERLLSTMQGTAVDVPRYTAQVVVLRKVDPANRKVVYAGAPDVAALYAAGQAWVAGERMVPPWLTLPTPRPGARVPQPTSAPHVAPLGLIAFTRKLYIRGGTDEQEVRGISAGEALDLFLTPINAATSQNTGVVYRVLRLVLARRAALLAAVAHARRRVVHKATSLDQNFEALRTVTVIAVLLHKLGRSASGHHGGYMTDAAFQLGQLLAAADAVHAGYCADVRGGQLPPSLLGNQVFAMAQTAPAKALAQLGRRWKPYAGWARQRAAQRRPDRFVDAAGRRKAPTSMSPAERADFDREMAVRVAISQARRMDALAAELKGHLDDRCDDVFRAELLLGYIAGLPKVTRESDGNGAPQSTNTDTEES